MFDVTSKMKNPNVVSTLEAGMGGTYTTLLTCKSMKGLSLRSSPVLILNETSFLPKNAI